MSEWLVPMKWAMSGVAHVEADNLQDAMKLALLQPRPEKAVFVGGTYEVYGSEAGIRELYNDNRFDDGPTATYEYSVDIGAGNTHGTVALCVDAEDEDILFAILCDLYSVNVSATDHFEPDKAGGVGQRHYTFEVNIGGASYDGSFVRPDNATMEELYVAVAEALPDVSYTRVA